MAKPAFKNSFVENLIKIIPENIEKEFKFEIPKEKIGYIRLDKGNVNSIYLNCNTGKDSNYTAKILLKFKYRDFHYVKPDFIFDKVYVCVDGCNEYRYDKNLNLDAAYLKGIAILPNLTNKDKKHLLKVIKEWEKLEIKLKNNKEYVTAYQIMKNGEKRKLCYVVCNNKIRIIWDRAKKNIDNITRNFNIENCTYFCKAEMKNNKIIKKDSIYLSIKNYKKNDEKRN